MSTHAGETEHFILVNSYSRGLLDNYFKLTEKRGSKLIKSWRVGRTPYYQIYLEAHELMHKLERLWPCCFLAKEYPKHHISKTQDK